MGTLFLVATPIGNLEDISPRALDTLRGVSWIAAEDTRTAKQLLNHFAINTPVISFFEHSSTGKLNHLLARLKEGDVAVISEAGMPGINDPGSALVQGAVAAGHRVSPIPGASAVLAGLVASGLEANAFYYVGFLPRESRLRRKLLQEIAGERATIVAFETPHRLREALADMEKILGPERRMCAAREITKKFEEFQRGTIAEVRAHFESQEPRGEFTLVIAGASTIHRAGFARADVWDDKRVAREMRALLKKGVPRTEAVKQIAHASGRKRREIYGLAIKRP